MHLSFEQFPALSAIKGCSHVFVQRIPGIDVSHDKAEVLDRLDAAHREIRHATGFGDWPLFTAQQVHGNKIVVIDSRFRRLSPLKRGEDKDEGFKRTDPALTLTLPLSALHPVAIPGEATQDVRSHAKNPGKTGILEKRQTEFPRLRWLYHQPTQRRAWYLRR